MFDYIIKNAKIFDGVADAPFLADIGINNNRIAEIGQLADYSPKLIDASGLIATPGFVDIHTHCDLSFKNNFPEPNCDIPDECKNNLNFLYQGVTTVVTGNCGLGYDDTVYWLTYARSIDFKANVYHLVPHGTIRNKLFGSNHTHKLNEKELVTLNFAIK